MDVVFIGTGDAFGAGGRRQAAILLRVPKGSLLLDCGMTTLTGLASLGIGRDSIGSIAISHFHADHFGGIPSFLLAAVHEDKRRGPLTIIGPTGVEDRVMTASAALGHPFDPDAWLFPLSFQETREGADVPAGPFHLKSFATHHVPDSSPHGWRVTDGSRTVVYTGDTGWFDALPERARGADLFICECTLEAPGFEYHLSLEELSSRRDRFECGRIVLTHLGPGMAARRDGCGFETADDGLTLRI